MLEQAVQECTEALHVALSALEKMQQNLEYQLYIQSRLVAPITHDISGPFNYLITVADQINELISTRV